MNGTVRNSRQRFFIQDGELLFRDAGDGYRMSLLAMAKNSLFGLADNIGTMECEGFCTNKEAIRAAIQKLYDELLKEFDFKVQETGEDYRFELVRKSKPVL